MDIWNSDRQLSDEESEFGRLSDALRVLQDTISGVRLPAEVAARARQGMEELTGLMKPYSVPEAVQASGRIPGIPGRAQALLPVVHVDEADELRLAGHVTFGRYYLGGFGAAHGGAIPLMFDEMMGRLSNAGGRPMARTAYLNVNFRTITPIDVRLRVEILFGGEEGRKRYITGAIYDGETVTADAEALFITLLPGQR
ncbi:PaaI family thioesterase [Parafrankia sp. FMc2]|uniref:PaaI family thioesterase n=1 Tax=Parafrankia sp. FMc2 TaxID=3233196 RepID=UPI0034D635F6